MQSLSGKRGLIMGVANDRSIAWGIAKACHVAGAELAFSYQGEGLKKRVGPLAAAADSDFLIEADVGNTAGALGPPRFRGPCHRLLRQE